jgi:adenylosuccinate lyase
MTGDVINLNKARKARAKAAEKAKAEQNRAGFGRTKGQKAIGITLAEKLKRALDDAKRDPDRRS